MFDLVEVYFETSTAVNLFHHVCKKQIKKTQHLRREVLKFCTL